MMHTDMLLLAERLVVAMETMSQDVKNLSAYVYDISCSVSYLLSEKREKESISVVAHDEDDVPSSVTFGQYEEADEGTSSYSGEHGESSFGDIPPTSIDPHENSDVVSSESHPSFTGGIKIDEQTEVEVNDESHDTHKMYENSKNNVTFSKEVKCETQWEAGQEDQAYGLNAAINHFMGHLKASKSIATAGSPSRPVPREIQCVGTSSSDHSAFRSRLPDGQTSVPGTSQMQIAEDNLMVPERVDLEESLHKCSLCEKSFASRSKLEGHMRVHTREKPYKCAVCGKAFSLNGNLTKHMRSHTGERPYSCNVCGKAFSRSDIRNLHMRSHRSENTHNCNVCGKRFLHRHILSQHMCTHSGQYPN